MRPRIILAALAARLVSFAGEAVVMDPGDGATCYSSTIAVGITELLVIFNFIPGVDLSTQRTYIFCPQQTITIGIQEAGSNPPIFQGGDFPLPIFNPNIHVKCGESGQSSNGCVLSGGRDQVVTLVGTELLEQFLLFLPLLLPELQFLPGDLPEGYKPDSSSLLLEGMTFQNSGGDPEQGVVRAPVNLAGPGRDMVFTDCRWESSDDALPPTAGFAALYWESANAGGDGGPYMSLTIKDSAFMDNTFTDAIILTEWADGQYGPGLPRDGLALTVEDCLFKDNIILDGQAMEVQFTDAFVTTSCFVDNQIGSKAVIAGYNSTVSNSGNYGADNAIPETTGCGAVEPSSPCEIGTYNVFVDGSDGTTVANLCPSSPCVNFEAEACAFDIATKVANEPSDPVVETDKPTAADAPPTTSPVADPGTGDAPTTTGPLVDPGTGDGGPVSEPGTREEVTCEVCPDGSSLLNPGMIVQHSSVPGMTCGELQSKSASLSTGGTDCLDAQALSIIDCGCPYVAPVNPQCSLCVGGPVPNPSKLFNPKDSSKICGAFEWQASFLGADREGDCAIMQATAGAACDCEEAPAAPCDASCPNGETFDMLNPLTDGTVGDFVWKGEWLCGEILWAVSVTLSECTELAKQDLRRKCCPGGGVTVQEAVPTMGPAPAPSSAMSVAPFFIWIFTSSLVGFSFCFS